MRFFNKMSVFIFHVAYQSLKKLKEILFLEITFETKHIFANKIISEKQNSTSYSVSDFVVFRITLSEKFILE